LSDTIREFLVGIGFKVDQSSERQFTSAMEGAVLKANLLATAIEGMAKTVAEKVGEVAEHFEQLYYQSQLALSSVPGIMAFQFAFKQLGSSVGDADTALNNFGYKLRTQPGFEGWVSRMGVATRDTNGQLRETSKIIPELAQHLQAIHNPALSNIFREALGGISDQGWRTLNNPEFWKQYSTAISSEGAAGIDNDAAKKAAEFEQQWREVWKRIGDMAEGGESKLLTALTEPMEKFNQWLDANAPKIDDALGKMATSVGALTAAWVDDLDKVKWEQVATSIQDAANSIENFTTALIKDLPLLQAFLGALVGAKFGSIFGPWGALAGLVGGAAAPSMIEQEMDPNAPHAADTGVLGALGRAWGGVKSFFGGGGGNKGVGGWWTPERMKYAADRLVSEAGLSQVGAAGLVARWAAVEAPGGPTSSNNIGGGHWGIGQWSTARGGPAIGSASFEDQVSHAIGELKTTEARAAAQLRSAKTEGEAAVGASMFERAENYNPVSGVDDQTANTPVGKVLKALGSGTGSSAMAAPKMSPAGGPWVRSEGKEYATDANGMIVESISRAAGAASPNASPPNPLNWDVGPGWDSFNKSLPTGPSGGTDTSNSITSSVTNNITVSGGDAQATAAMVGVHLDRTANDISRNLQGAFQ
jgi:hypothetical protein